MTREAKRKFFWIVVAAVLFLFGLPGVPSDMETLTQWINWGLASANHGVARFLFCIGGLLAMAMIFYPPNIRQWIWARLRCGHNRATAYFADRFGTHGTWSITKGSPACTTTTGGHEIESYGSQSVIEYTANPDECVRYVWLRGRPLTVQSRSLLPFQIGAQPEICITVRKNSDNSTETVTIHPVRNGAMVRMGNEPHWQVPCALFSDHLGLENMVIDVNAVISRAYRPDRYTYLGVNCVRLKVHQALMRSVTLHEGTSLRHLFDAICSRDTWVPWTGSS